MNRLDASVLEAGEPSALLEKFGHLRAVVVGEAMLDVYISGSVDRLCPEGPFPVVDATGKHEVLGGAANVAANLAAVGASVSLVTVVGDDAPGDTIFALASKAGIDTSASVRQVGRMTLSKLRVVGDGRSLLRVDEGSTDPVSASTAHSLLDGLSSIAGEADVVVISDYRYGVIGDDLISLLAAFDPGVAVVVDSKDVRRFRRLRPRVVTSNYSEVIGLVAGSDRDESRPDHVGRMAQPLLRATGAATVAVTLDADGVVVVDTNDPPTHIPARASAADPCGAGDTFTAVMALGVAAGGSPAASAALAGRASAVVVSRPGTAVCDMSDLRAGRPDKWFSDADALVEELDLRRLRGETVVFTNGCFDVLHAGHVASLSEAADLGDVLVVAVNDDAGVARLKGAGRPVHPLADRASVLAGLAMVDYVVSFTDDSPLQLLARVRPDVYCKGGDYRGRWIPEMELVRSWGGRFVLTDYLPDRSTTSTVERVRSLTPAS